MKKSMMIPAATLLLLAVYKFAVRSGVRATNEKLLVVILCCACILTFYEFIVKFKAWMKWSEEKEEAKRKSIEQEEKLRSELGERILELKKESEAVLSDKEDVAEGGELHNWCKWAEQAYEILMLTRKCIDDGKVARLPAYSGPGDREKNLVFQENMELLMEELHPFLSTVGRVRFLPGMRMKTIRGTRRNLIMNGKTLAFFWKDHPSVEIDILDFDLRELYGSWAVGDTLDRKLKELDELESLICWIIEEKLAEGEGLLRKVRTNLFQTPEKDIFGFEKQS